jgi:hypothetical protein
MKKMKIIAISSLLFLLTTFLFAQEGAEHKLINIIGAGRVEINIGEQFDISAGDIFQVFGKGQIIHPATGKLVERDNVYLGKIKVLEVKKITSIAEIIEKKGEFLVGNRIVKVVTAEQVVIENKKPLQSEFENPKERNYAETIYTQNEKKAKPNKEVHIIEINEVNHQPIAIIDKGKETKAKGGKPSIDKKYYIFVPIVDTSSITGQQRIEGEEYIGSVKISIVEHDASKGYLSLNKNIEYNFIKKDNRLLVYNPKLKGWGNILRINLLSFNYLDGKQPVNLLSQSGVVIGEDTKNGEKMFTYLNGFEIIRGYRFSPVYFLGAGVGYNNEYHKPYRDALIMNIPLFLQQRINILNKKNSLSINLSIGKNTVLNSNSTRRPYKIFGGVLGSGGLGLKTYIKNYGALLFDVDLELKNYLFENYSTKSANLAFLKLKIGFELN